VKLTAFALVSIFSLIKEILRMVKQAIIVHAKQVRAYLSQGMVPVKSSFAY